jgi:predicted PhzF superfamily epimerase YddE/YHI9
VTQLDVLRVFAGPDGRGGNPLGVFLDGPAIAADRRQTVAHKLNYAETVFVDAVSDGTARIAIYTPGRELGFAGHPTVGTSWLVREAGHECRHLTVLAGTVDVWADGELAWIRARAEWVHPIEIIQHENAAAVEALTGARPGHGSEYVWAWIDEPAGILRSRYFAPGIGVPEDEATGAAAVVMGARLGRPLTIRQGVGSELYVRPGDDGTVAVGGRVSRIEQRDFA